MLNEREKMCGLLDALYLEMFDLMEQQTVCRVNIERLSNGGHLLLAKTRYTQGSQTISTAQIPTENSDDFKALCRVVDKPNDSKVSGIEYALQRHAPNRDEGYIEPMNWFGVLAPSSLRAAADQFKKCLEFVVESANLQKELVAVMDSIERLKKVKIEQ